MKYLLMIYQNPTTWANMSEHESQAMTAEVAPIVSELTAAGERVGGEALAAVRRSRTVGVRDGVPTVTDGPYLGSKEHLVGHMVVAMTQTRRPNMAERLLRRRRLARAPIWIYRARLGVLLGTRVLMLEHVGRRTGVTRYVVLEAASRPAPGVFIVVSGFGTQSQWFQNVMATPTVRISAGRRYRRPARVRRLEDTEAHAVLERYAVEHPRAWRTLAPIVEATAERDPSGPAPVVVEFRLD